MFTDMQLAVSKGPFHTHLQQAGTPCAGKSLVNQPLRAVFHNHQHRLPHTLQKKTSEYGMEDRNKGYTDV